MPGMQTIVGDCAALWGPHTLLCAGDSPGRVASGPPSPWAGLTRHGSKGVQDHLIYHCEDIVFLLLISPYKYLTKLYNSSFMFFK